MTAPKNDITQNQLKEILRYDPETGIIYWLKFGRGRRKTLVAGNVCTNNCGKTYNQITVGDRKYMAHRLAFLYMTGRWPKEQIDHVDGNGLNNKWSNLFEVTHQENSKNQRLNKRNSSGCPGVRWDKIVKKWKSTININGKNKTLGFFIDKLEAIKVRKKAEKEQGYHENHGSIRPL